MSTLLEKVSKIIPKIDDFKDTWGLIVQEDSDGGDSLQRNSHYFILLRLAGVPKDQLKEHYRQIMNQFEIKFGIYRRHPDPDKWYSDTRNTSRDQISIAIQSMVMMSDWKRLLRVTLMLVLRLGFHQNYKNGWGEPGTKLPDWLTIGEISMILRGLLGPLSVIPNTILDIFAFGDLYFRKKQVWDYDNMLASQILISKHVYPTIFSKLIAKFYKKTDYIARIEHYHGTTGEYKNGIPPLGELYSVVAQERM